MNCASGTPETGGGLYGKVTFFSGFVLLIQHVCAADTLFLATPLFICNISFTVPFHSGEL